MSQKPFLPGTDWTKADPLQGVRDPIPHFRNPYYFCLNQRRFEHLVSLGLRIRGLRVLETGAGIGDHTEFLLDRECTVTVTEGRAENLSLLERRYKKQARVVVRPLDLDALPQKPVDSHDLVYYYGVLYHLERPEQALAFLAPAARELMLVETVTTIGEDEELHIVSESESRCSQSLRGYGCRPTRQWVLARLRRHFQHVYLPLTQPWHSEFPLDWTAGPIEKVRWGRAVFVASRTALPSPLLVTHPPVRQRRH